MQREIEMERNVDRISKLPQSLQVKILSFLPMKEAARTSVLSKEWCGVWKETCTLEFNENDFVNHDSDDHEQYFQRGNFARFVEEVVFGPGRFEHVRRFSLVVSRPNEYFLNWPKYIKYAISEQVRDLELDFSDPECWSIDDPNYDDVIWKLPNEVYDAQSLESLKLVSCICDVTKCANFTTLKNLYLARVPITMSSINVLLGNCPLLESFGLKKCSQIDRIELNLPNSRLNHFEIENCRFQYGGARVSIKGPKLKYFKYHGEIGYLNLVDQNEMVEADLDFYMEEGYSDSGDTLCNILEQLYAIQLLAVCSVLLQIVPSGEESLQLANATLNVRHLILKTRSDINEFYGVVFMLRSCPRLKTLTYDLSSPSKIFDDYEPPQSEDIIYWEDQGVERCLEETLKVVNYRGFKGTSDQLESINYFLQYGRSVRRINVYISPEDCENEGNRHLLLNRRVRINREGMSFPDVIRSTFVMP